MDKVVAVLPRSINTIRLIDDTRDKCSKCNRKECKRDWFINRIHAKKYSSLITRRDEFCEISPGVFTIQHYKYDRMITTAFMEKSNSFIYVYYTGMLSLKPSRGVGEITTTLLRDIKGSGDVPILREVTYIPYVTVGYSEALRI